MDVIKQEFYIEVTDKRVDLDPPYVWQSEPFETLAEAEKFGKKVAESFRRSDLSYLTKRKLGSYLNPDWEVSAKAIKTNLKVDIMSMDWISEDEYDIGFVKRIKI